MKIVKSTNSVIHDVFWAYLSHNSLTDFYARACVFKSRKCCRCRDLWWFYGTV